MAPTNSHVQEYFQPSLQSSADHVGGVVAIEPPAKMPVGRLVIKGSDDEDSDSDSSLEELNVRLQFQSATRHSNVVANDSESSRNPRVHKKGIGASVNTSPLKPRYKFNMETLIKQAEIHQATEASALSMKTALECAAEQNLQYINREAARDSVLKSVVAEQEGTDINKVLQAVKRTEAIRSEDRWYFFDIDKYDIHVARQLPMIGLINGWKRGLVEPRSREQFVLSNFARDMVGLGDTLPDEFLNWMLYEICFEYRDDLRGAYCNILIASTQQLRKLVSQATLKRLFKVLGGTEAAVEITEKVKPVSMDHSLYESHDWKFLRAIITFVGHASEHFSLESYSYTMCLLVRLCIDRLFVEDNDLLAAIQKTMEQVSGTVGAKQWEKIRQETCDSTFKAVELPTLQLQILRCIPQTTRRIYDLRRRLALAFFFRDAGRTSKAPYDTLVLREVTEQLKQPQFKINKDTNYHELAALMSILDIAIDNGLSSEHNVIDYEGELKFNTEVDDLAARIKQIWSCINDAGASFMSRINAKEVIQGVQMRLEHAIRTKPKPKLSIFEPNPTNYGEDVQKQSAFIERWFKKKTEDEDLA